MKTKQIYQSVASSCHSYGNAGPIKTSIRALAAAALAISGAGCRSNEKVAALKPSAPKPEYITGHCVDTQNKPLSGVEIFMKGVTFQGGERTETFTKTKTDGSYEMRVPSGLYAVYATYSPTFNDLKFKLTLEASDGESDQQDSTKGVVEDFVWKIQGLRPGEKAKATSEREWNYSYYGARVYPDARRSLGQYTNVEDKTSLSQLYPPDSKIEITLVPQGSLIDGTTGKTITESLRMGDQGLWTFGVRNIPIGIYTATAKVVPAGGNQVPVKCKVNEEGKNLDQVPWTDSARITFPAEPTEFSQAVSLYLAKP